MNDSRNNADAVHVACEVCLKEIPPTHARKEEADDYVMYFCGLECYTIWRRKCADSGKQ